MSGEDIAIHIMLSILTVIAIMGIVLNIVDFICQLKNKRRKTMSEGLSKHDEIIAEAREKYTVHHCGQCELRKSCINKFDSDECKDTRQSIMLGFGIEDGYFTKLLDRLEAAHKREVADALDVGVFLGATKTKEDDNGND